MSARFHITIWPGAQIPVPPVSAGGEVELLDADGSKGGPFLVIEGGREPRVPPEELYLREIQELDVEDVGEFAAFTAKYGRLGASGWGEVPGLYGNLLHSRVRNQIDKKRDSYFDSYEGDLFLWSTHDLIPLEEIALHVHLLRDLTRVWEYHKGLLSFDDVVSSWENRLWYILRPEPELTPEEEAEQEQAYRRALEEEDGIGEEERALRVRRFLEEQTQPIIDRPEEPADLYMFLHEFLAAGLSDFHARPIIYKVQDDGTSVEFLEERPQVSLYGALCLQLANHIVEEAVYHKCEKCGRLFVRQRGGAKFGQHRMKSVLYCSPECARAKAQQEYRKNKSQATRYAKEGLSVEAIAAKMDRDMEQVRKWIKPREAK